MLVLASESPRRRELLKIAGYSFAVRPSRIAEERREGEAAIDYVRRLAREKAEAVECAAGDVVLGADTVVVCGEQVLEKPRDEEDAKRMVRMLAGREHEVITGICLRTLERVVSDCAVTTVWFAAMDEGEISAYVDTGEPLDKAGAYGIQGQVAKFVERIDGDYYNVMGLPLSLVYRRLKEFGLTS